MKDIEYILDFTAELGRRMLACGANLERVNDTMTRVCASYGLEDVSIYSLNSIIQISASTKESGSAVRQVSVPPAGIHLEKLNRLNKLSRTVCSQKPEPLSLRPMLIKAEQVDEYPEWAILTCRLISMICLAFMFDGTWRDAIASVMIVFVLYWLIKALQKANFNAIIVNLVTMFVGSTLALMLCRIDVGQTYSIIMITCGMLLIPGISMVNAVRNLLCANEMNGILELIKALLETFAIVLGIVASLFLFGGI